MATPVGKKPASSTSAVPASSVSDRTASRVEKKATGVASLTADGVDPLSEPGLIVRSVRGGTAIGDATEPMESGNVSSSFPLDDLGRIETTGRWAQGFRLDSGSLRLMWMNARRFEASDGTPGFELFFQLHGAAFDTYRARIEERGATSGHKFEFFASTPATDAEPGKTFARRTNETWGPASNATRLSADGWTVDFVAGDPEALKGGVRIQVRGDDATATQNLKDVIKSLGLQSLFAPPAPNALEKFKLLRLLWQVAPHAAESLRGRNVEQIKLTQIHALLEEKGIDPGGDRVKGLRFQEVYPGYFTVVDPLFSETLRASGARYLYSTSDSARRVLQQLSGGQKSSLLSSTLGS